MTALPRRTIHHGVVRAQGLWFSAGIVSIQERQRRVLAVWEPGAQLFAHGDGYIVRFHEPRSMTAAASLGAPLTLEGNTLTSAPLRAPERATFPEGAWLILVEAGLARAFSAQDFRASDPADWLDLSRFRWLEPTPLEALDDPPLRLEPSADPQREIAQRLARTDQHRQEQGQLFTALNHQRTRRAAPGAQTVHTSRIASGFMRALLGVLSFVLGLRKSPNAAARSLAVPPPPPGLLQRLEATAARWIARSRLMTLLAHKQAEYLQTLLDALEAHDDMEVLRRAIPLSKGQGEGVAPALSAPTPRTDFRISLSTHTKSSVIGLGDSLFGDLRRAYEAVLERLTRAGKHEEAAFFLAEILKEPERAVDYLERHGQLQLAAELAEARGLAPGLIVRLWFLAGDSQRALAIAVREDAFADAILRLERSGKTKDADALRLLQADRLASAGHWLAAARLVHARPGGAVLALRWLELLRQTGDVRGVALELSLEPRRFDVVRAALEPLLALRTSEAPDQRALVACEFKQLNVLTGKPLARELTREILADAAEFGDRSLQETASQIADWLGGTFRADFPSQLLPPGLFQPRLPQHYRSPARDAGSRPIFDACESASRFVVALGEAGVLVLNREGKRAAHFDTPADRLVVSDDGTRLLTLARRGQAWRVSQIDLATRRSRVWGELRADAFAPNFDGQTWVIARIGSSPKADSELLVLDVFDDSPSVLRRTPVSGVIDAALGVQVDANHCNIFVSNADARLSVDRLRFDLPSWTLRERKPVNFGKASGNQEFRGSFAAFGSAPLVLCMRWSRAPNGSYVPLAVRCEHTQISLPTESQSATEVLRFHATARAFAASLVDEKGDARVFIGSFESKELVSVTELAGARTLSVRLNARRALIGDEAGRLLAFDLTTGRCVHDLRL